MSELYRSSATYEAVAQGAVEKLSVEITKAMRITRSAPRAVVHGLVEKVSVEITKATRIERRAQVDSSGSHDSPNDDAFESQVPQTESTRAASSV